MGPLRVTILCFIVVLIAFSAVTNCGCPQEKVNQGGAVAVSLEGAQRRSGNNGAEHEDIFKDELEDRLVEGLIVYSQTGNISTQLYDDLEKVQNFKILQVDSNRKFIKPSLLKEITFCTICRIATRILLTSRQLLNLDKSVADTGLKMFCYQYQSKRVCDGLIDLNIDILLYIIDRRIDLSATKTCNIIAQAFSCQVDKSEESWSVNMPIKHSSPPKLIEERSSKTSVKPLRIMHITDIHYDDKYRAGGNAKCGEPLCCGIDQGEPAKPEDAAGVWGDYRSCDMPLYAIENLMDEAAKHDVDFIYHTGDIINHRVWETARATNTKSILKIYELFRTKFPNKQIFHIAGNHEPNPINEFAPETISKDNISTTWLYDLLAKEWNTWLPDITSRTIRRGGYYTVLVRPGFRIVAMNSNVCYVYNWWLLYNDRDPDDQLQWLSDTLYQAEINGEVVHILTHIPSGNVECHKKWSHEYNRILRRYASIIKAQFVGHTHFNEIHLFYDDDKKDPINVAFNGGSFTTFVDVNPNFRIYDVNPETYQVEDYEDWIYNITEANRHGRSVPPKWYKLYNFKEAYGLKSLDLPELGKFVHTLATNNTALDLYFRLKVRDADASIKAGCDQDCKEEQLCNLVTSEFGSYERCEQIISEFRQYNNIL